MKRCPSKRLSASETPASAIASFVPGIIRNEAAPFTGTVFLGTSDGGDREAKPPLRKREFLPEYVSATPRAARHKAATAIDVREWARRGYLRPNQRFSWSWFCDGEPYGGVTVRTEPHPVPGEVVVTSGTAGDIVPRKQKAQTIDAMAAIEKTDRSPSSLFGVEGRPAGMSFASAATTAQPHLFRRLSALRRLKRPGPVVGLHETGQRQWADLFARLLPQAYQRLVSSPQAENKTKRP
jgi:hypothetical protein